MYVGENQIGKGAKGLPQVKGNQSGQGANGKSTAATKDKNERKNPISRSSRANYSNVISILENTRTCTSTRQERETGFLL